ncbi:MAG TPA: M48 family metalloprotease [Conexivisphaerales archaeon]|nr:M48 family metalloprotease [Conexivisphaerales archaeon]
MARLDTATGFGRYIIHSFKVTKALLVALLVLSIFPGGFLLFMPQGARVAFSWVYMPVMAATILILTPFFTHSLESLVGLAYYRKKYPPAPYSESVEVNELAKRMGIKADVKVFETDNPAVKSPFTNLFYSTIYYPRSWFRFKGKERLAIFGHELDHIKDKRRFLLEVVGAILGTYVFTLLLGFIAILIVCEVAEFCCGMLAISYVSWRNERRADSGGAAAVGAAPLISVFEALDNESKKKRSDGSSLTHPPFSDRIRRLYRILESEPAVALAGGE